jgi:ATP synthase protein I
MAPDDPKKSPGLLRQLSLAMELPFVLVGGVLIGGGIGWLLDRWLHTAPWLLLVCGLLGFGGGMRELLRRLSTSGDNAGNGQGEDGKR